MKVAIFTIAALLLAGCGHNAVTYGDGVQAELGFIPDQYKVALTFRYGKIFSAVVKEKTKLTLTTDADNNGTAEKAGQNTNVKTTLTFETGDQITGYGVEKAKVEAAGGSTAKLK
jgi:hypothetical protein